MLSLSIKSDDQPINLIFVVGCGNSNSYQEEVEVEIKVGPDWLLLTNIQQYTWMNFFKLGFNMSTISKRLLLGLFQLDPYTRLLSSALINLDPSFIICGVDCLKHFFEIFANDFTRSNHQTSRWLILNLDIYIYIYSQENVYCSLIHTNCSVNDIN